MTNPRQRGDRLDVARADRPPVHLERPRHDRHVADHTPVRLGEEVAPAKSVIEVVGGELAVWPAGPAQVQELGEPRRAEVIRGALAERRLGHRAVP